MKQTNKQHVAAIPDHKIPYNHTGVVLFTEHTKSLQRAWLGRHQRALLSVGREDAFEKLLSNRDRSALSAALSFRCTIHAPEDRKATCTVLAKKAAGTP